MTTQNQPNEVRSTKEAALARIETLFRERGASMYAGEPVTQLEHALQAAQQAEEESAPLSLVVAALLHDLGHLMHQHGENCADEGIDDHHEELAARWLDRHFPAEVVDPIRLHVAAKRYRCATDPAYHSALSAASQQSLQLQGGPMSSDEVAEFERHPNYKAALRLRTWDEGAKISNHPTPPLEHYLATVAACMNGS